MGHDAYWTLNRLGIVKQNADRALGWLAAAGEINIEGGGNGVFIYLQEQPLKVGR